MTAKVAMVPMIASPPVNVGMPTLLERVSRVAEPPKRRLLQPCAVREELSRTPSPRLHQRSQVARPPPVVPTTTSVARRIELSRTPSPRPHQRSPVARPPPVVPTTTSVAHQIDVPPCPRARCPQPQSPLKRHITSSTPSPHRSKPCQRSQSVAPMVPTSKTQSFSASVAVIAPGAGTTANAQAYRRTSRSSDFTFEVVGQSRAPYDQYPGTWPNGSKSQNLETFAKQVLEQGIVERSDALVVGSRGGQVVLPWLWKNCGQKVPPAVVINGGCAMQLPAPIHWPTEAVTFLLIGGQDSFRNKFRSEEYLEDVKGRVPKTNGTTAVLFINEMVHMPQGDLLEAVLAPMLNTIRVWNSTPSRAPVSELYSVFHGLQTMRKYSGCLAFTRSPGDWKELPFGMKEAGKRLKRTRTAQSSPPSAVLHTKVV